MTTSLYFARPPDRDLSSVLDNIPVAAANANMAITSTDANIGKGEMLQVANGTRWFRGQSIAVGALLAVDSVDGVQRAFYAATVPDGLACADFDLTSTG